ncbi:MAG TPA: ATP-binding protein [Stenomitos sp.]
MPNNILSTEQLSHALISNLPGGAAFVVDRDLRYLLAEGEALTTAGFKPEEFIGRTIFEVLPSDLATSYEPMYRQAFAGKTFEDEHQAHGHTYLSRGTPLRSDSGEIYAVLVVSYDITERKRSEEALRESEERFRTLANTAPALIWYNDAHGNNRFLNQSFLDFTGKSAEQIRGEGWHELIHPDDAEAYIADYLVAVSEQCSWHNRNRIRRHDGVWRWHDNYAQPLLNADGVYLGHVVVSIDNTEAITAEIALHESEQRYRHLVELTPQLVWNADEQGRNTYVSPQMGAYIGLPSEQLLNLDWETVIHPQDVDHVHRSWTEAVQTGIPYKAEYRLRRADGEYRWHLVRAVFEANGQGRKWFGVSTDIHDRKQAEAALRESEEKYRSLFTSIDEGFNLLEMISDESGRPYDFRIVETNPAREQQTGLTDAVGKTLLEIAPDFEQQLLDFYSNVVISGRGRRTEYYTAAVDRWYTVYASRIGGEGSRQVAVVFNDITERKCTEEQLRRAADMDAFRVKLSDALRSLSDAPEIQRAAMRILGEHLQVDRVMYAEIDDEETYSIAANYVRGAYPTLVGRFPTSDFGTASERLRAGETFVVENMTADERLSGAARAAFIALDVYASVGVPLIKAGRWVANLGIQHGQARQWTEEDIELVQETAERTWAAVERARAEAALRKSELQRVREQSAREQERQRAESLAELDRAKTAFFSNVSHEFRTPLTLSLAPLQDALNDRTHPLDPVHRERLELVHRNSLRLLKLVNTLLDFSRIEAGRMEAVYEPTDLATFTADLSSVFRSAIERAGLQLSVDCPPLPEPVFVDREMWEKIVLNLLSNAFKFTFQGVITVRLRPTEGNQVVLQIQDTGTGIGLEHLPHLFERFYQVRSTQARTHEGAGIGLALVHELVRLHHGTIEVDSTLGVGTCFTVTLPLGTKHLPSDHLQGNSDRPSVRTLAASSMRASTYGLEAERWVAQEHEGKTVMPPPTSSVAPASPSARVLVVDDNADMREYLTRILSEHIQVEAVADGATALAMAQAQVPDLILSDVMMPSLDGFELLEALRADPRTREIPIILLSARAGEEAIIEGLEAGADDYLIKPFSAQELLSRITAHLQIAQLRSEALQQERTINRQKDEFISVVSHELNTPLVSILGWTRLLRSSSPTPVMLTKALDTIERNAILQGKLVQDLLDLSRISTGKFHLNPQHIELQPIIETAIATMNQSAVAKDIALTFQENITEPVVVMGDSDRLSQVLINLLSNAIKFTPPSGTVKVELSVFSNNNSMNRSCVEIRVTDTGMGIRNDFLPHVFERFRQGEGAYKAKGLGLGLAIARHIVELHNGTIQAQSAGEAHGSTFIIRIPIQ